MCIRNQRWKGQGWVLWDCSWKEILRECQLDLWGRKLATLRCLRRGLGLSWRQDISLKQGTFCPKSPFIRSVRSPFSSRSLRAGCPSRFSISCPATFFCLTPFPFLSWFCFRWFAFPFVHFLSFIWPGTPKWPMSEDPLSRDSLALCFLWKSLLEQILHSLSCELSGNASATSRF